MSTTIRPVALADKSETQSLYPSANVQQKARHPSRTQPLAICYYKVLQLPAGTSKISICAKPTYCCRVSFEIPPSAMHITRCLLDAGTRLGLINKTLVSKPRNQRIQRGSSPQLRTATEQPLHVKSKTIYSRPL